MKILKNMCFPRSNSRFVKAFFFDRMNRILCKMDAFFAAYAPAINNFGNLLVGVPVRQKMVPILVVAPSTRPARGQLIALRTGGK